MMNSTVTAAISSNTVTPPAHFTVTPPAHFTATPQAHFTEPFKTALIIIYGIVLVVGSTGLTLMISLLKTNIRSLTTIAFLNLMVAHFLFLLTVPFRIYYYATQRWELSHDLCKVTSAMIHIHMYMVFLIYAIVLTLRFLQYYKKTERTEFYRRLHALAASAGLWCVLIIVTLPTVLHSYGHGDKAYNTQSQTQCFNFDDALRKNSIFILNVIISVVFITVSCVQACIQTTIMRSLILRYGPTCRSQQEFWLQMKNLCFVLIMLICLVPYHLFRMRYLKDPENLHEVNEVFLAITAFTCVDMLTFVGKGVCQMC